MIITGQGWKACKYGTPIPLIQYIQKSFGYFRVGHFLYKVSDSGVYQFHRNEWISVNPSFNLVVQPVYDPILEQETEKQKPIIDFTKNLETTSGLPAKLLINDFWESRQEYNFLCLIKDPAASHDLIRSFNKFGECGVQSNLRLQNCPKKISIERFVNIHRNGSTYFYEKQDLAFANRSKDHIAVAVPITINTIEGFDPRNIA